MTELTQANINYAFVRMKTAESNLGEAIIAKAKAKETLATNVALLTAEGLEGNNADERKADLVKKTGDQTAALAQADVALVLAKVGHAVAKAEVDRVKYTIRFMEIAAHAASNV